MAEECDIKNDSKEVDEQIKELDGEITELVLWNINFAN
jgi:hypothetical protein